MKIEQSAGYVTFWLTSELRLDQSVWLGFINEFKESVPPGDREYKPDTKEWAFHEKYLPIFRQLKTKYFENENQESLF